MNVQRPEPLYKVLKWANVSDILKDEKITTFDTGLHYLALGTDKASLFMFDLDGNLIVHVKSIHKMGAICAVLVRGKMILTGGQDGYICIYYWIDGKKESFKATSTAGEYITCIAVSDKDPSQINTIYYGTSHGRIKVRNNSGYFAKTEVLFSNTGLSGPGEIFNDVWSGVAKENNLRVVRKLSIAGRYLLFLCGEYLHIMDINTEALVTQFHQVRRRNDSFSYYVTRSTLVISWGRKVYFCALSETQQDNLANTFQVHRVFEEKHNILELGILHKKNLMLLQTCYREPDTHVSAVTRTADKTTKHKREKQISVILKSFNLDQVSKSYDVLDIPSECCTSRKHFVGMKTGTSSDDPQSITGTDKLTSLRNPKTYNDATSLFVVFHDSVIVVLPLKVSERVLWLVEHYYFPRAIFLCKKHNRRRELLEVANQYALYLWETTKEYQKAVQVWGQYVLPYSTATYWESFAHRLNNCNKLELLEDFLPTHNPSLLSDKIYYTMLESYLIKKDYKGFYKRVVEWGSVFPVNLMIHRIEKQIYYEIQKSKKNVLIVLHKSRSDPVSKNLRICPNFWEASRPSELFDPDDLFPDDSSSDLNKLNRSGTLLKNKKQEGTFFHRREDNPLQFSSIPPKEKGSPNEKGKAIYEEVYDENTEIDYVPTEKCYPLYAALFHILDSEKRLLDVSKLLVSHKNPHTFDYIAVHNLIKSILNTPPPTPKTTLPRSRSNPQINPHLSPHINLSHPNPNLSYDNFLSSTMEKLGDTNGRLFNSPFGRDSNPNFTTKKRSNSVVYLKKPWRIQRELSRSVELNEDSHRELKYRNHPETQETPVKITGQTNSSTESNSPEHQTIPDTKIIEQPTKAQLMRDSLESLPTITTSETKQPFEFKFEEQENVPIERRRKSMSESNISFSPKEQVTTDTPESQDKTENGVKQKKLSLPSPICFQKFITIHKVRTGISVDSVRCFYNVVTSRNKGKMLYSSYEENRLILSDLLALDTSKTLKNLAKNTKDLPPVSILPLFEGMDPNLSLKYIRLCQIEEARNKHKMQQQLQLHQLNQLNQVNQHPKSDDKLHFKHKLSKHIQAIPLAINPPLLFHPQDNGPPTLPPPPKPRRQNKKD